MSLVYILESNGKHDSAKYWQGVLDINTRQKTRLAKLVAENEQSKCKIAVFGFSYKKNTSDTRSAPAVTIVSYLARMGFHVVIHDP